MAAIALTGNALSNSKMEYHGKCGHTLGRIQHIAIMIKLNICYENCHLETQTVAPTLNGFQYIK